MLAFPPLLSKKPRGETYFSFIYSVTSISRESAIQSHSHFQPPVTHSTPHSALLGQPCFVSTLYLASQGAVPKSTSLSSQSKLWTSLFHGHFLFIIFTYSRLFLLCQSFCLNNKRQDRVGTTSVPRRGKPNSKPLGSNPPNGTSTLCSSSSLLIPNVLPAAVFPPHDS